MITPGKVEKRINREINSIKKTAVKEVVKTGFLAIATFAAATAVTALFSKEDEGPSTEDYQFDCFGISASNDGRMVIVTLEEANQLKEILKDYHWISGRVENKGKIIFTNGKDEIYFNEENGQLYNEKRNCVLTVSNEHNQKLKKIFED